MVICVGIDTEYYFAIIGLFFEDVFCEVDVELGSRVGFDSSSDQLVVLLLDGSTAAADGYRLFSWAISGDDSDGFVVFET